MAEGAEGGGFGDVGIVESIVEGGPVAMGTAIILILMSVASWYVFFVKMFEQQKILREGRRARATFWQSSSIKDGATKLDKNGAYRQIVDDGMRAQEQHTKLTDPIDQHDWMLGSLARSQGRSPPSWVRAWRCSRPSVRPRRSSACSAPWSASIAR
jgi:biopolymer transport protein ExbB